MLQDFDEVIDWLAGDKNEYGENEDNENGNIQMFESLCIMAQNNIII